MIVSQNAVFRVISYQIIILVIQNETPWVDVIPCAVIPKPLSLTPIPLEILKTYLRIQVDGGMDFIYIAVDARVRRFNTSADKNLPLKLLCLMNVCQSLRLLNKYTGFFSVINFAA